jgi:hypothetical protein
MADLLTREYAMEKNFDPTGKQWGAAKVNSEIGLWRPVVIKDGKNVIPTGLPDYLQGMFTTADRVMTEIKRFLAQQWDLSEEQAQKNARTQQYKKVADA